MRKNIINITLFASLLTLAGCSNEADIAIPDSAKTPIALSVGVDAPQTRAVITDGIGKTLHAFDSATDIWMVMQSEYVALSGNNASPSDIDYKGNQTTTNCVTMGTTGDKTGTDLKENVVNFTSGNIRYWDDAHARSSRLSIWALAVPNKQSTNLWSTSGWGTTAATTTKDWTISSIQTSETVANEDLCFSNNISKSGETYDERMKFDKSSDPKAFDQGKLIFYHALTKITVVLKEGEGFNNSSTEDFNIDNGVTLNGFNLSGTFNVVNGEFTSTTGPTATTMACGDKSSTGYTLEALVMPGTDLNGSLTNAISFSIDGNAFNVSAATLKQKLIEGGAPSFEKFEAGNNYKFTFTINKTDIDVTATIAAWIDVTAEDETPLINVTDSYGQEGTNFGKSFSFLRSTSIDNGYSKDATVNYADSKYTMVDQLYWPNHSTHYFFRGIWPLMGDATDGSQTLSSNVSASAITVANGAYSEGKYPSDLMLGYPRTTTETCPHGNTVATDGICATEGTIRMNFQYVMSQVEVNLQTSDGTDKVVFDSNTKVEIVGAYTDGTILLSDGSASLGSTTSDYEMHRKGSSNDAYHDAIIPQGVTALKFRITVTDPENSSTLDSYETVFAISEIKVTEDGVEKNITAWEPGKHYVYNLLITKTGIKVTATIKDWITATGSTNIWM